MSAAKAPTLAQLQVSSIDELETLFAAERPVEVPCGCYRGTYLQGLQTDGARKPSSRLMTYLGFQKTPFGVDFDASAWFFWHPRLLVGRFRPVAGRSRWRDADAVTLHYEASRLPAPIRGVLYDEVKPLSDSLCLGLGGLNADRGEGDLFFFALERIS